MSIAAFDIKFEYEVLIGLEDILHMLGCCLALLQDCFHILLRALAIALSLFVHAFLGSVYSDETNTLVLRANSHFQGVAVGYLDERCGDSFLRYGDGRREENERANQEVEDSLHRVPCHYERTVQ